jgi:hypothetical protein
MHLALQDDDELEDYGLVDDCPVFPELWDYVLYVPMACYAVLYSRGGG